MNRLSPRFLDYIPRDIEEGILYISIPFNTAVHKCACGCGNKTVTRLSPYDWKIIYDGTTVSLSPSIGNWGFTCRSHYWVRKNKVEWAEQWTEEQVIKNRSRQLDLAIDPESEKIIQKKENRYLEKKNKKIGGPISRFFSIAWSRIKGNHM